VARCGAVVYRKHMIVVQGVGGSNPLTRPIFRNKIKYLREARAGGLFFFGQWGAFGAHLARYGAKQPEIFFV